jgi:hypothetical protein
VSALRAGENRVTRSLTIRRQTDAHELVALQFLLAAQAANCLLVRIVGNITGYVDGWFHASSFERGPLREWSDPVPGGVRRVNKISTKRYRGLHESNHPRGISRPKTLPGIYIRLSLQSFCLQSRTTVRSRPRCTIPPRPSLPNSG